VLTESMTVETMIDVGKVPYWATTSADGRTCFVSLSGEDKISVIDYASGKETKLVPVGKFPQRSRIGRLPANVIAKLSTS
jgi:YVTN family beta-propeller protein